MNRFFATGVFFCWVLFCSAQQKNSVSKLRFQIEYGKTYCNFIGKPSQFDGFGYGTVNHYSYNPTLRKTYIIAPQSSYYFSVKGIYEHKHMIILNASRFTNEIWAVSFPDIGLATIGNNILSVGYGYILPIKKIRMNLNGFVSYRKWGGETYVVGYFSGSSQYWTEPIFGYISYTQPWGGAIGTDIEYFVTGNIGLGINLSYYYFPFEQGKISRSPYFTFPPELESERANQKVFNATVKLFYNFSLPVFKKKASQ